jgi:lysophospholipase L1-like esterase
MISRFLAVVALDPAWIICMPGTNDARLHGEAPTKCLVSPEETALNLEMLASFARTQTSARWVWMTPARVIEEKIGRHWFLGPLQVMWRNTDLDRIAEMLRRRPEPTVDVQAAFGWPLAEGLLLPDGLHPSLAGQKRIVRALVEQLSEIAS